MKIALASDHAGFAYKERLKSLLADLGHTWKDFGTYSPDRADYPDFVHPAAESVAQGECERGIFVCGSGIGVGITANRHRGVRAASCQIVEAARLSRLHNDANVLAIGARLTAWETVAQMVELWLVTPFEGGRHEPRIAKIER
ncbi:MAG: ribose 5-phosphate isomerase B [Bacteroidota bacterium]|nr:ribose 5-phosphate isomerase B [Bacteroidota bacterium]